jgi:hypothetical protein
LRRPRYEDADSSFEDESGRERLGGGAASLPEYWLELCYEKDVTSQRIVVLSTDSRRCINGEVSWSDVVSSQWHVLDRKRTRCLNISFGSPSYSKLIVIRRDHYHNQQKIVEQVGGRGRVWRGSAD